MNERQSVRENDVYVLCVRAFASHIDREIPSSSVRIRSTSVDG